MSLVEDLRQVLQDFVAPELKSLEAKISALESSVKMGFSGADQLASARHDLTVARLDAFRSEILTRVEKLTRDLEIDRRLEAIERRSRVKKSPTGSHDRKSLSASAKEA